MAIQVEIRRLLDDIRSLYVTQVAEVAAQLTREPGGHLLREVVLRDSDGRAVGEGTLDLPMRLDLATVLNGAATKTISVDSQRLLQFEPIAIVWAGSLRVALRPFHWDSVALRFRTPARSLEWAPFVAWYRRWFREDEEGERDSPLGVVHFLSDPEVASDVVTLTADLGSAPVVAFEELLDALVAVGANDVVVQRPA